MCFHTIKFKLTTQKIKDFQPIKDLTTKSIFKPATAGLGVQVTTPKDLSKTHKKTSIKGNKNLDDI